MLTYLLSKGAEVDSESDAGTPLIWAAGHDQQEAVKVLLEHHANVFFYSSLFFLCYIMLKHSVSFRSFAYLFILSKPIYAKINTKNF